MSFLVVWGLACMQEGVGSRWFESVFRGRRAVGVSLRWYGGFPNSAPLVLSGPSCPGRRRGLSGGLPCPSRRLVLSWPAVCRGQFGLRTGIPTYSR